MRHKAMTVTAIHNARPRERHSPARMVQNHLKGFEGDIDNTLAANCELLAQMIRVGNAGQLTPDHGQPAIEAALTCLTTGVTLRTQTLALHEELRVAAGKIDLKVLGWGGLVPKPSRAFANQPIGDRFADSDA